MAASNESIFIAKGFDQVAFVVEDLEPATKLYSDLFGVERWSIWSDLAKDQVNKTYRGEPGDFQFSCAYGYAGDILIELCHHDGGKSVYKDWLDTRGAGIHHVGFRVVDANEFAEVERLYGKQGIEAAMGGELTDVGPVSYTHLPKLTGTRSTN